MLRAVFACFLAAALGAFSPSHALELCVYNLVEPEGPYYLYGQLITPQASIVAVAECGTALEDLKAAVAFPPGAPSGEMAVGAAPSYSSHDAAAATPRYGCAENGSCYGDISAATGRPKTVHVQGYYRKDGTYVRGHYRSAPRH